MVCNDGAGAELRRRTVTACTDCRLCYIQRHSMNDLKMKYPELALRLKRCTRIEEKVNRKGRRFQEALEMAGQEVGVLRTTYRRLI